MLLRMFIGWLTMFFWPLKSFAVSSDTLIHVVYLRNSMIFETQFPKWSPEKVNRRMEHPFRYHLFFNADTAYECVQRGKTDRIARENPLGRTIRQHTQYQLYASHTTWNGINYPFKNYAPLEGLLKDTSAPFRWQLFDDEKIILGYTCKLAIAVRPKGDSVIAWYTTSIPGGHNRHIVEGLPGTVLDYLWQEHNDHYFAIAVEKTNQRIVLPDSFHVVSPAEWQQALKIREDELRNELPFRIQISTRTQRVVVP